MANQQMQNSWQMGNAQREAAANAAMWQGMGNAVGAGLNAYGQYQGSKPAAPNPVGPTQMPADPKFGNQTAPTGDMYPQTGGGSYFKAPTNTGFNPSTYNPWLPR